MYMYTLNTKIPWHTRKCGKAFRNSWAYIDTTSLQEIPSHTYICRAMTRLPRPSSTAECLRLIAHLREEQASAASWEPRPPFEAAEMD